MNTEFKYLIVEDSLKVCEGIAERMSLFTEWKACRFAHHVDDAKHIVANDKPLLIFIDWSLKGGSAYEVLGYIQNIQDYNPYIIFNTGFQSDNPEIPQEIINNFRVDKYLVKTLWEKLRNQLGEYIAEAEMKAVTQKTGTTLFLTDKNKISKKTNLADIVCICIDGNDSFIKVLYLSNGNNIELKITWQQVMAILEKYKIDYFITNSKQHLIIKDYVQNYRRPFIYLKKFPRKIEVVKDKLAEFEKWLKTDVRVLL